jgi:hypothetical protein
MIQLRRSLPTERRAHAVGLTFTYDEKSFSGYGIVPVPTLAGAAVTMEFQQEQSVLGCTGSVAGVGGSVTGPVPTGIAGTVFHAQISGADVELDYFIQIHSDL